MQWYPWLAPYHQQLVQQHQQQRAHHARLIHALPGMGAEALVWGMARWLMCLRPQQTKACGECHGCKLMIANHHPDWYPLRAEKGKHQLGIDMIREACEKLYYRAQQGGAKIVWIESAEQLTEAAANALLKTLEEPPENCWFFITTTHPESLPATLRSRCMTIQLLPPAETQSLAWLLRQSRQNITEMMALSALRLTGGAPGAALALLTSDTWQQRQHLCQVLQQSLPHNPLALLSEINISASITERLHWLITIMLDVVKVQQGAEKWLINSDQQALVISLAKVLDSSSLQKIIEQLNRCRYQLLSTPQLNHELMLCQTLLEWESLLKLK